MKSRDYWKSRSQMLEKAAHKRGEDYNRWMEEAFYKASQAVQERLAVWYQRYADNRISLAEAKKRLTRREMEELRWTVEEYIKAAKEKGLDGQWVKELENASARAYVTRLEEIQMQTRQQAELLYQSQMEGLDRMLRGTYREGYYHAAFELQKDMGVSRDLSEIDSGRLEKALHTPWTADGLTFRDRWRRDKQRLIASLKQQLVQGCIRGETLKEAMKDIARQFGVSCSRACRMIMTENAYFHGASQRDSYRDLGVEKIEIVEILDWRTCGICRGMHGKVIPLEDSRPGETTPPFHPMCRGYTLPYFGNLGGEREKDNSLNALQPMEKYRRRDGSFDLDAAKTEYRKFLQSVPEKNKIYLEQALDAVGFEQRELKRSPFGYDVDTDIIAYNSKHPSFYKYDFRVVASHELAHRIDHFFVQSWEQKMFSKAIADARDIIAADPEKFLEFAKGDTEGFLSDIFSAVCEDDYRFRFYHDKIYWQQPGNKEKEIFANLFSLEAFENNELLQFLIENLPNVWEAYTEIWR